MGPRLYDMEKFIREIREMGYPTLTPGAAHETRLLGEPSSVEIEAS